MYHIMSGLPIQYVRIWNNSDYVVKNTTSKKNTVVLGWRYVYAI